MSRNILELQGGIIYGPINSRRLGSSLGLNILPPTYKACPFNCAYCQYGYTPAKGFLVESDGTDLPTVDEVVMALTEALDEFPAVGYITFSGNGEPTLHPDFSQIVDEVKILRDKYAPQAKTAILSNSAFVFREHIRRALCRLDARFMKLDAGDEETFKKYNRANPKIKYADIVDGLKRMDSIIIQALFAGGIGGNYNDYAIDKWIEKIGEIKPVECHIYSLDRPSADKRLTIIDRENLTIISDKAGDRVGVTVRVF
jgi:wyosine [tRNA(Phe)-imidazoG37] synthetase (radical SAM superfamily)